MYQMGVRRIFFLLAIVVQPIAQADELRVAVASNFLSAARSLNGAFERQTGHTVHLSAASTAKLTAQILNGARFDILLAANEREPQLIMQRRGLPASRYQVYARGRLVLASTQVLDSETIWSELTSRSRRLAIANPRLAPYGQAAQQVLLHQGVWSPLARRVVRAENVGQAFQFVYSGQARWALVAYSQVLAKPVAASGVALQYIEIPPQWYQPVMQGMLRLGDSEAARAYFDYIRSSTVQQRLVDELGYAGGTP